MKEKKTQKNTKEKRHERKKTQKKKKHERKKRRERKKKEDNSTLAHPPPLKLRNQEADLKSFDIIAYLSCVWRKCSKKVCQFFSRQVIAVNVCTLYLR